ncbi:unnamed protein product [Parascedosporium putredinis]|uniref:RNA-binding S4 domain-containing protein n=1 Tax=Parascedosporium putredinis TaxID=1442378 RepID=A0A9P1H3W4_9PEZI|nr:unnamed protein product [Parascedosporium putredinis]CAI7995082.1 unnamed protein product [Parascedosporium putredinis]
MREAVKRHVLGRSKLRQSWNKYNLYNIHKNEVSIRTTTQTFFQQKWAAKSMTRAYHGEHVNEKRWSRLFSRRLTAAVEMPPEYLASYDGSEQAEGRGSGKQSDPNDPNAPRPVTAHSFSILEQRRQAQLAAEDVRDAAKTRFQRPGPRSMRNLFKRPTQDMTPYMQMAFAPLERRLEVAMFRAMFASSPRQARQFCVHGAVKVNGKKMRYGSYQLNPGDMFEVDPDKVMFAAGKDKNQASLEAAVKRVQAKEAAKAVAEEEAVVELKEGVDAAAAEGEAVEKAEAQAEKETAAAQEAEELDLSEFPMRNEKPSSAAGKKALGQKEDLSSDDLMEKLASHLSRFKLDDSAVTAVAGKGDSKNAAPEAASADSVLSETDQGKLLKILRANEEDDENPVDPSKPYATPWQPRKFLEPFAFIPATSR